MSKSEALGSDVCGDSCQREPADGHQRLGTLLASYRGNAVRSPLHLLALLAGAIFFGYLAYRHVADAGFAIPEEQGLQVGLAVMSAGAVICTVLLVLSLRGADCALNLFDQGLVYRQGKRFWEVAWGDIEAVFEGISLTQTEGGTVTNTSHKIRLRLADKRIVKLNLSFLDESDEASAVITASTFPRILARAKAALAKGEAVDFDNLKLRAEGISQSGMFGGENLLAWDQISEATVSNGFLVVKKHDAFVPWTYTDVADIPNFRVLHALLEHHLHGAPLEDDDEQSPAPASPLLVGPA